VLNDGTRIICNLSYARACLYNRRGASPLFGANRSRRRDYTSWVNAGRGSIASLKSLKIPILAVCDFEPMAIMNSVVAASPACSIRLITLVRSEFGHPMEGCCRKTRYRRRRASLGRYPRTTRPCPPQPQITKGSHSSRSLFGHRTEKCRHGRMTCLTYAFFPDDRPQRHPDDSRVYQTAPMVHIPDIEVNFSSHDRVFGLSPEPPGESRPSPYACGAERPNSEGGTRQQGPRSDQAHVSLDDVQNCGTRPGWWSAKIVLNPVAALCR